MGYDFKDYLGLGLGTDTKGFNSTYISYTIVQTYGNKNDIESLSIQQWYNSRYLFSTSYPTDKYLL